MINATEAKVLSYAKATDNLDSLDMLLNAYVIASIMKNQNPAVIYTKHVNEAEKILRSHGYTVVSKFGEINVYW